ncbi:MAG: CatB-related O-acetyltransferase [Lachnospiraceae bacterium]|jgi:acetyltransferase-like isoleucine patch superfamily enzyme|nr:CatB-related O-acetyltransferase [Lachnospiraceae bacterium]
MPYREIRKAIQEALYEGKPRFIIYPYGEMGMITKQILYECFGIKECLVMDNKLSDFNLEIKKLEYCKCLDTTKYKVLFTCANSEIYDEVYRDLIAFFPADQVTQIFKRKEEIQYTECGKYSYGPLCNHNLVEVVGAFCSFAAGVNVVVNHAVDYITTHPFIYHSSAVNRIFEKDYDGYQNEPWYFPGVEPKSHVQVRNLKKCRIGNDVWLGKNVLITNGAYIGNGAVAGAGAVITKDVPDYAVVAGVPARVIRYRYKKDEIEALNRIAWWNWPDEKIRENYEDFYLDIKEFIRKHDHGGRL